MTIKPECSDMCDIMSYHYSLHNWNTSQYDHYSAEKYTSKQIDELEKNDPRYNGSDRERELEELDNAQYHDMNEYHNELAEEFADEF